MPILMPDTSAMEDLAPSVPGTYRAKITKADAQISKERTDDSGAKKGGNQMLVPFFTFTAPRLQDKEARQVSRRTYLNISGAGSAGFDQLLRCIKETALADLLKSGQTQPVDTDLFVGKEVMVVVSNEPYTPPGGSTRINDRIDSFLPV